MQRDLKFNIISEGIQNGISVTCRKYNISRTLYYRWLKRYKSHGIEGLSDIKRQHQPKNKTSPEVEQVLFKLIRTYPRYGPKAIKYLLEELDIYISESAVFNVMKRHGLTNKESREKFAQQKEIDITRVLPSLNQIESGECWLFWITDYGNYDHIGPIYEYSFMDYRSRIACSRLYSHISYNNFEDLLTAVAIPVAQSLSLRATYLCFFQDAKVIGQAKNIFRSKISRTIKENGFDVQIHVLRPNDDLDKIIELRNQYTEACISYLMPYLSEGMAFADLKMQFQHYVRSYNMSQQQTFTEGVYSPVEYHNKLTDTKLILPLWAYIDRAY